jgi:hypothetical protein
MKNIRFLLLNLTVASILLALATVSINAQKDVYAAQGKADDKAGNAKGAIENFEKYMKSNGDDDEIIKRLVELILKQPAPPKVTLTVTANDFELCKKELEAEEKDANEVCEKITSNKKELVSVAQESIPKIQKYYAAARAERRKELMRDMIRLARGVFREIISVEDSKKYIHQDSEKQKKILASYRYSYAKMLNDFYKIDSEKPLNNAKSLTAADVIAALSNEFEENKRNVSATSEDLTTGIYADNKELQLRSVIRLISLYKNGIEAIEETLKSRTDFAKSDVDKYKGFADEYQSKKAKLDLAIDQIRIEILFKEVKSVEVELNNTERELKTMTDRNKQFQLLKMVRKICEDALGTVNLTNRLNPNFSPENKQRIASLVDYYTKAIKLIDENLAKFQ